jgi:hypothetical protein
MRMGKVIHPSHDVAVRVSGKYALRVAVPVAVVLGTVCKRKSAAAAPEAKKPDPTAPAPSGRHEP